MRLFIFGAIFATFFFVPLVLITGNELTAGNLAWSWVGSFIALIFLRGVTVLANKGQDWAAGKKTAEAAEDGGEAAPAPQPVESYVAMLTGLVIVGPYVTLALALAPFLVVGYVMEYALDLPDMSVDRSNGLWLAASSIASAAWLLGLQAWGRVRIDLPIIPIPMLFLTPVGLVVGLYFLITG
jgi:hypothetical protein